MNGPTLVDGVREDERTELDRLGSDKAMIAATDADLAADPVLEHVAATLAGLRETCEEWAETTDDADATALFAATAEAADEEYGRVTAAMDGEPTGEPPAVVAALGEFEEPPAVVAALGEFEEPPARVGALVGEALVAERTLLQTVNFFVNEADERRADLLRDVRTAAKNRTDEAAAVLDSVCVDDADWDEAETAAVAVVDAAYAAYADALDALGIDPKPVC
jgi:hypothetical protein